MDKILKLTYSCFGWYPIPWITHRRRTVRIQWRPIHTYRPHLKLTGFRNCYTQPHTRATNVKKSVNYELKLHELKKNVAPNTTPMMIPWMRSKLTEWSELLLMLVPMHEPYPEGEGWSASNRREIHPLKLHRFSHFWNVIDFSNSWNDVYTFLVN